MGTKKHPHLWIDYCCLVSGDTVSVNGTELGPADIIQRASTHDGFARAVINAGQGKFAPLETIIDRAVNQLIDEAMK